MGRIIGIDLGTTYSAVGIPEERNAEGFITVRACPGVSIIQDRFKNRITPSVVAEDSRGELIVGRSAKNRAGMYPEPIMFAKRSMGEDVTFQLDKQGVLTPVQVSAAILKYLKTIAEERLGEPVDEAVITVPAYFHMRAKQATQEAGELAGLRVAQVAPEPVAAALMYCASDDRDPLRVMTYDLGGGTFDVAILEKRDGTINTSSMLNFGGDRFLGGYNFDLLLTEWLQKEIRKKGYNLSLDFSDPKKRVAQAKLMLLAEKVKLKLSDDPYFIFQEENLDWNDDDGNPISLEGIHIERATFEQMIAPMIEKSIDLCRKALEEATPPVHPDSLHEILMVGGSSRIPMVGARLEAEFKRKPKLVEPDLCVALGAAILAGRQAKSVGRFKLNPIPKETEMTFFSVTGHVLPANPGEAVGGFLVQFASTDGSYQPSRVVDESGSFSFDRVPLAPNMESEFNLILKNPGGGEVDRLTFRVRNSLEGGLTENEATEIPNVLSKPILLGVVDGMYPVAPALTPLPYNKLLNALTTDTSGSIRLPIFEENNPLGEIQMTDIPKTLPVGSTVEIEITIQNNYQIVGRAQVKSLGKETSLVIDIPIPPKKSLQELRSEYLELQARAEEAIAAAPPGVRFGDPRVRRLRDRLKEVEQALNHSPVEEAMVQDRLDEATSLVREIGRPPRLHPPRSVFDERVSETREVLQRAIKKDSAIAEDGYDKQIDAIVNEGNKAFQAQDIAKWRDAYENIDELYNRLEKLAKKKTGADDDKPPVDIRQQIMMLNQMLNDLVASAKKRSRYEEFRNDFENLAERLKRINPDAPDANAQIYDWYFTGFEDLRARLDVPERELGKVQISGTKTGQSASGDDQWQQKKTGTGYS